MAKQTKRWKFIFKMDSSEILIHDAKSAENFIKLLGDDLQHYWDLSLDQTEDDAPSAPAPVAAPPSAPQQPNYATRRKHSRHSLQMSVIVVSGGKCMLTQTQDVSEGGIRLAHAFREKLGAAKQCRVFVKSPDGLEKIEFHATLVDSEKDSCRLAFDSPTEQQRARFHAWVDRLLQQKARLPESKPRSPSKTA
jgi:hypothetical protein